MTYPAVNSTVATPWRQGTVVTVPPSIEPISLADAKLHLRIEPSDTWQDDHIDLLIVAARAKLEADLGFAVMAQTLRTDLSCFPSRPATYPAVWLGGGASAAVSSIVYIDSAGAEQTIDSADYLVDAVSSPALVVPAPGKAWPATQHRPGAVRITWTAGWASAAAVPSDLIHAMKLLLGHWFENREAVVAGTISGVVQLGWDALVQPHRMAPLI